MMNGAKTANTVMIAFSEVFIPTTFAFLSWASLKKWTPVGPNKGPSKEQTGNKNALFLADTKV
jgi:hypothetical protein